MDFSKSRSAPIVVIVAALSCAWSLQIVPAASQEQQQEAPAAAAPAPADQPAQAAPAEGGDAAAPAAEPSPDASAPAPTAEPSPDAAAPAGDAAAPAGGGTGDAAPVQPEQPAASAPTTPEGAATVTASQIQIGAAVFGADGAKIGEVNGVKSDDSGKVQEILVTDGTPAGMNAKVFAITADKITSVADGVKLSMSAEDAKKLPIIDNGNG
jgi:hypothetical protein